MFHASSSTEVWASQWTAVWKQLLVDEMRHCACQNGVQQSPAISFFCSGLRSCTCYEPICETTRHRPYRRWCQHQILYRHAQWDYLLNSTYVRVQELCQSAGGRLAPSLIILNMSVDGKQRELHERTCPSPIPGRAGNCWPDGVWRTFAVCHLTWRLYAAGPFPIPW